MGVYDALENLYDGIAVYGSPKLYDVVEAYAIPPWVQAKLHYCGYVARELPAVDGVELRQQLGLSPNGRLVLATVGGGYDGYPVLEAAAQAIERLQAKFPELIALLVTGPLMPAADQSHACNVAQSSQGLLETRLRLRRLKTGLACISHRIGARLCRRPAAARSQRAAADASRTAALRRNVDHSITW